MHSNLWIDAGCPALYRFLISRKCPFEFNDRIRATHLWREPRNEEIYRSSDGVAAPVRGEFNCLRCFACCTAARRDLAIAISAQSVVRLSSPFTASRHLNDSIYSWIETFPVDFTSCKCLACIFLCAPKSQQIVTADRFHVSRLLN